MGATPVVPSWGGGALRHGAAIGETKRGCQPRCPGWSDRHPDARRMAQWGSYTLRYMRQEQRRQEDQPARRPSRSRQGAKPCQTALGCNTPYGNEIVESPPAVRQPKSVSRKPFPCQPTIQALSRGSCVTLLPDDTTVGLARIRDIGAGPDGIIRLLHGHASGGQIVSTRAGTERERGRPEKLGGQTLMLYLTDQHALAERRSFFTARSAAYPLNRGTAVGRMGSAAGAVTRRVRPGHGRHAPRPRPGRLADVAPNPQRLGIQSSEADRPRQRK